MARKVGKLHDNGDLEIRGDLYKQLIALDDEFEVDDEYQLDDEHEIDDEEEFTDFLGWLLSVEDSDQRDPGDIQADGTYDPDPELTELIKVVNVEDIPVHDCRLDERGNLIIRNLFEEQDDIVLQVDGNKDVYIGGELTQEVDL